MLPTVKIGGSLVRNAGVSASTCLVSSRWFSCGVAVSMGKLENLSYSNVSPLDAALPMRLKKNTQHDTSKVLRLPRKMTMDTPKVLRLPRKMQHIFWKRRKSIAPATRNDFRHVAEHVWMSRSATPATRNEATRRLKPPKRTTSAKLPIGTAIRSSRERLRTAADAEATSSEHALNPQTPESETGTCFATHFRELETFNFADLVVDCGNKEVYVRDHENDTQWLRRCRASIYKRCTRGQVNITDQAWQGRPVV